MKIDELIAAPVSELRSRTTPILILERLPSPCSSAEMRRTPSKKQKAERKKLEEISSELSASRESRKPGRGGVSGAASAGRWNHEGWANGKSPREEAGEREARTACPTTKLWHRNRRSLNVRWNYVSPFKISGEVKTYIQRLYHLSNQKKFILDTCSQLNLIEFLIQKLPKWTPITTTLAILVLPSLPEACTSFRKWKNAGSNGAGDIFLPSIPTI
nr:hypothetical protein Iba_chr12fCG10760 [Ipomoea batatas]